MSNFSALKTAIQNAIKQNGNEEITGNLLQGILLSIVETLGDSAINTLETGLSDEATTRGNADTQLNNLITGIKNNIDNGYVYAGIATPSTTPVSGKVFYIALQAGTYTNFGGTTVIEGITILKYNGTSWVKEQVLFTDGGVFDISAYHATGGTLAKYADLTAALGTSGANIPGAIRKGGMSVKYVQTSDNKYVQYRLMVSGFSTSVTDWQGVDEEPVSNSKNLVESGGTFGKIKKINDEIFYYNTISEELPSLEGSYIKGDGSIDSINNGIVHKYLLPEGVTFVRITNTLRIGNICLYAFYSSSFFSSETVVGEVGIKGKDSNQDLYIVDVPSGASYVGVSEYHSQYKVEENDEQNHIEDLLQEVDSINEEIDVTLRTELDYESFTQGYITGTGDLSTTGLTTAKTYKYKVEGLSKVQIKNTARIGSYRICAFYNDIDFSSSTAVEVATEQPRYSTQDYFDKNVPAGAKYLGISVHSAEFGAYVIEKPTVANVITILDEEIENIIKYSEIGKYAYSFDGENLFVAFNENGNETTFWFKKAMANELYTFYRIGYRFVDRPYPSIAGIEIQDGITPINSTASDNIGPLFMENGGVVGGNHVIESGGNTYKTAKNDYFNIYIDNKLLTNSESGYADNVSVLVKNTIYDPSILPSDPSATILSEPLSSEYVTYSIIRNNIEVAVMQVFSETTQNAITNYYGMQSMFVNEDYYMTPNGEFTSWRSVNTEPTNPRFKKVDYPNFNRFLEKSTQRGVYQAAYLLNNFGIGDHSQIGNNDDIFVRGQTGKDYHVIIRDPYVSPLAGKVIQWRGVYTFFHQPLVDDTYVMAYRGVIMGKDAIFINTMSSFSGTLPIPKDLYMRKMSTVECYGITNENGTNEFQIGGNDLYIESSSTGSLILTFD